MEYLEGGSFDSYIKAENGLSESEALTCIRQIGEALQFMHNNRMLHLDLKPKNIMRRKDGSIVLIDFGLSKQYNSQGEPEQVLPSDMAPQAMPQLNKAVIAMEKVFL